MRGNARRALPHVLKHEGGYVNHPHDPGGPTNMGVTIGTMRGLGMDLDGDGDVDVADVKALTQDDVYKVWKRFYWDAVQGDLLPSGVDYAVADNGWGSGPRTAAMQLQELLGVARDGDVGPVTLAAAAKRDPGQLVNALCDRRLRFMRALSTWKVFGKGWTNRVEGVRKVALEWAQGQERPFVRPDVEPQERPKAAPKGKAAGGVVAALLVAAGAVWVFARDWITQLFGG